MVGEAHFSQYRALFEAAAAQPSRYPADRFEGRGIVICAGGARLFTCAWVAIGVLRRVLGCSLPIQVWHLGPAEMGPPMRALLEEQGVEVIDAHEVAQRYPVRTLGGWELKPYAIIHSRFREVLLLDADNVPAVDPGWLFDSAEFAKTGAIFWPDIVRLKADNPIWEICAVPHVNAPTIESGQVVVDKQRCWHALQLTMHMNEHSDFYYQHLYGDKDTFFIAWHRLAQRFAMTAFQPHVVQTCLYQRDFQGRTIFQHRTQAKWTYDGANSSVPGFQYENECMRLLADLHEVWNGRVFQPPATSPATARVGATLLQAEWFDCLRIGAGTKRLQLLSANRIGEGRGQEEFYWYVEEDSEGVCLVLEGRRRTGSRFRPQPDGCWSGRSLGRDRWNMDLQPVPGSDVRPAASPDRSFPTAARTGDSSPGLLERVLAVHAARSMHPEAVRDLIGALRLLAATEADFAAAIVGRLSADPAGDDDVANCLRAVLSEQSQAPAVAGPPLAGHGSDKHVDILGVRYQRID